MLPSQALDKLAAEWEAAEVGVLLYRDSGTCVIKVWPGRFLQLSASFARSNMLCQGMPADLNQNGASLQPSTLVFL